MQGLDSFLMSVIIHDLSTGELVNEWYRCVLCDPMGRTAFVGVRKKSVLELNPKRWIRFWKVDRDEEADWPFHFNVKIHPVNHRANLNFSSTAITLSFLYLLPRKQLLILVIRSKSSLGPILLLQVCLQSVKAGITSFPLSCDFSSCNQQT